jgi:hypothetical protein
MNEYTCRGDTVQVFPGAGVVVVTTTTRFDVKQPHHITRKLPMQQVLPKL